jgi:hypothetical protein
MFQNTGKANGISPCGLARSAAVAENWPPGKTRATRMSLAEAFAERRGGDGVVDSVSEAVKGSR